MAEWFGARCLACTHDNMAVRMLLWPHKLIPIDDFIDAWHDRRLLPEAIDRLAGFAFVDMLENPQFFDNLGRWLSAPVFLVGQMRRVMFPSNSGDRLAAELTLEAFNLLVSRSRLNLELWRRIARQTVPGWDPVELREQMVLRNIAYYTVLMMGALLAPASLL